MRIPKPISAILGGLLTLTVTLLTVGFATPLYNYFIHPTIVVGFSVTRLENGSPDRITVTNQGNAAATEMLLTISAPQQVRGQILLAPDKNTMVDNGSHCGVNCFSVSIPSFSHGGGSLDLSSLISNKSNIASGNYTVIASYAGTSARFVQPLLEKPYGPQTSTPSPFSSLSMFTATAAIGGIVSAITTAYFFTHYKERLRKEQATAVIERYKERLRKEKHPDPEININIERIFMINTPKTAEEMLKRFFQTEGEKQE